MDPKLYRVSFPREYGPVGCLVEVCEGWAAMRTNLRIHFVYRLMRYTIVILEEGNRIHPRFPEYYMFVPWAALNRSHLVMDLCARGGDSKRQCLS